MDRDWAEGRDWSESEFDLFERMAHDTDALEDSMLQSMFDLAYYDDDVDHDIRANAREWISDYVEDVYGFDFDEYFDWDAWREEHGY